MSILSKAAVETFETMTDPPKRQSKTSLAAMAWLGPLLSVVSYGATVLAVNLIFEDPEARQQVIDFAKVTFGGSGLSSVAAATYGLQKRSLLLTALKGKNQAAVAPNQIPFAFPDNSNPDYAADLQRQAVIEQERDGGGF